MADKKKTADQIREERVKNIVNTVNGGEFGGERKDALIYLGSREIIPIERFPSGHPGLDIALGGGWPKGRFIELYGPESGGKSTLCLHAIANHQLAFPDEDVALIDTEFSFDEEYAEALKVDRRWLLVHQPDSGEQALNVTRQLVQMGVGLIIVDSVAALTTRAELEGDLGDIQVADQARLMSRSLRTLTGEAGKRRTTIIWTNQLREKIGVTYGDKTTTPAGRALKHYASIRASIVRIGSEKEGPKDAPIFVSNKVRVDVKKNKTAPPFRRADMIISFGRGIDLEAAVLDEAILQKHVVKKGSWMTLASDNNWSFQGRGKMLAAMREHPELLTKMEDLIGAKAADVKVMAESPEIIDVTAEEVKDDVEKSVTGIKRPSVTRTPVTKEQMGDTEGDGVDVGDA